jgi:hypothetical protein
MFADREQELLLAIVRQRAIYLREEQRKIEQMRVNLGHEDFMETEYYECATELIHLHIIFTKLCHL